MLETLEGSDTWIWHMRHGAFEEAWKFSDKVIKSGINRDYLNTPRHYQCIWDGTPLNGKRVLVRCYHGLGDTIMFIRYTALLKEIASEVIVWAQPELLKLLTTAKGIDRLIPLHNGTPDVTYDIDIELMELPHAFRTTLSSIPSESPYLHVHPISLPNENSALKIGLVWQAGDWDQSRNIPFSIIKQLGEKKGTSFYILQYNPELAGWDKTFGIYPGKMKLLDYARFIHSLDLLISVDSMPAHLAGAVNTPVWLMLKKKADWRWMEDRTNSPWYPSMRLFRQPTEGAWETVIRKIKEELTTPDP
ncbi:MAG TPA: glycosyltransferase family 9 protein [Bacteroidales bacterium]|nr:glycosyltransferase family 9 protein [Bacteroidales bacterium]